MRKTAFLFIALAIAVSCFSQDKFLTKTGHIWFFSHTPMEDIEGHNNSVLGSLNMTTGDVQFILLMKSFKFKQALMEEHFNENYAESDQFPKASFKGKITNLAEVKITTGQPQQVTIEGDLTIHGKTNPVKVTGTLQQVNDKIEGKAKFIVTPPDYNIKIEKQLEEKIAKNIEITVEMNYDKQ
jgi:polyisoprenoid-binding protein YceI